jgi:cation/acetate symporter
MITLAAVNVEATIVFAVVLSVTLGITYWASKRASSAVGFYAAGRQSPACRTGWRSPATTSRRRPSSASPG